MVTYLANRRFVAQSLHERIKLGVVEFVPNISRNIGFGHELQLILLVVTLEVAEEGIGGELCSGPFHFGINEETFEFFEVLVEDCAITGHGPACSFARESQPWTRL